MGCGVNTWPKSKKPVWVIVRWMVRDGKRVQVKESARSLEDARAREAEIRAAGGTCGMEMVL